MEFNSMQDVLAFAMEKEDDACLLYKSAAEMSTSVSARKMFLEMAEEEAGHKRLMEKLDKSKVEAYKFKKVPDLKISEYIHDVQYRNDMTYQEVLIYAMKGEEKSYRLYSEAASHTDDPDLQRLLLLLASEEKKHKFHLEALYNDKVLTEG